VPGLIKLDKHEFKRKYEMILTKKKSACGRKTTAGAKKMHFCLAGMLMSKLKIANPPL
jgi:hypothetical protein